MTTLHRERQATSISQRLVHITFWWAHMGLVGGLVLVSRAGSDHPLQSSLGLLLCLTGVVALLAYFVALGASARQRGKSPILWGGLAFISSPLGLWVSYGLQFGGGLLRRTDTVSAYRAVRLLLSQRGRAATAVLLLCSMAPPSSGHVTENHTTHAYEVSLPPGASLLNTLNNASPIRHQGRVFHGYTTWHVRWNYQWQGQADGSCAIASVDTRLTTAITLPQLRTADAAERSRFDRYLAALTLHEEGHKRLGQKAAADIDRAILKLRPTPTCQQLENAVHRVGHDILERTRQSEIEYDRTTRHGCTQGACLP